MNALNKSVAIQSAQMRQMMTASTLSLLVSTILAAILAFTLRDVVDATLVIPWFSLIVLIAVLRMALVRAYQKTSVNDDASVRIWLLRFRIGVLATGMVWGSAGIVLFTEHYPQHQMFLIFMLAGLTAGGVISYSSDLFSGIAFSFAIITPLMLRLFAVGDSLSIAMAMAALLYLGFMIMSLRLINRNASENILLHLEAAAREKSVRASEERYRLLLNHSPVGIFHYDTGFVITYCNDCLANILHSDIELAPGLDMKNLRDRSLMPALNQALSGEMGYYEGVYSATTGGADSWIAMTSAPSRDDKGNIIGGIAIVQNISGRKQAEDMLRSHTRELELNNHILSQINQHTPLPLLLDDLARRIETLHPGMICSILLLNKDGKTLRTAAAPSLPEFYNQAVNGLSIGEGVGSCGTAAFRGEQVIVEDVQTHPYWALFRDLTRRADVRSCWSYPFKNKLGRVLGTFAIYHRQPSVPTEQELTLVKRYANLVQLVIESYRAQDELRIAATAFESQEGMLITDANNTVLRVNSAFTQITGYAAEEVIGKTPGMLESGRHDAGFFAVLRETLDNTGTWEGEIWNRRKNGEIYPEYLTITAVRDINGKVTNYVSTFNDISASRAAADEIRNLAFYDPLTSLPNRRLLMDRLNQALAASARSGQRGALLFIDLDNFKILNDTLGHDIGDLLLQQVAHRLVSCVREGDTVARLGGDEFVVILEDLSKLPQEAASQTETVGEKILSVLNQPYHLSSHEYHNSPSIGATLMHGHQQATDELMKQADIAMYQAKKAGRNTLRFFDPETQDAINVRATLEGELRRALENRQLHLHYQIQVDSEGRPLGAEALIRWIHPERGMIPPMQFIPLAEETGMILPIGLWVLDSACRQLKIWQDKTPELVLAVNVSAKQFRQADFSEQVQSAVQRHAINPGRLKLELTESMLLDNIEDTIATMYALKKTGIQFSLDDFGTGYSSLQYLKRLPLDQLKIDQSFVRDITTDSSDKAIVHTIIAMAHSLNLDVIAEGVETVQQRNMLLDSNCLHFQGYLFGKPVPVDQFEALLTNETKG